MARRGQGAGANCDQGDDRRRARARRGAVRANQQGGTRLRSPPSRPQRAPRPPARPPTHAILRVRCESPVSAGGPLAPRNGPRHALASDVWPAARLSLYHAKWQRQRGSLLRRPAGGGGGLGRPRISKQILPAVGLPGHGHAVGYLACSPDTHAHTLSS